MNSLLAGSAADCVISDKIDGLSAFAFASNELRAFESAPYYQILHAHSAALFKRDQRLAQSETDEWFVGPVATFRRIDESVPQVAAQESPLLIESDRPHQFAAR